MLTTLCGPSEVLPGWESGLHALPTQAGHTKPHEATGLEPLQALFQELQTEFAAIRSRDGLPIDNTQPPESFQQLDGRVKALMAQYCDSHAADWRRYVHFNKLHYVRHLVDDCEEFELLVRGGARPAEGCRCLRGDGRGPPGWGPESRGRVSGAGGVSLDGPLHRPLDCHPRSDHVTSSNPCAPIAAGVLGAGPGIPRPRPRPVPLLAHVPACERRLRGRCLAPPGGGLRPVGSVHSTACLIVSVAAWKQVLPPPSLQDPPHTRPRKCQGELEEQRFRESADDRTPKAADPPAIPGVESVAGPCPTLAPCGSDLLLPGQTGYISDRIALHAVRCPPAAPAPGAVSLHLYAPPIRRVRLFDPEDNRVVVRRPGFWSVRGVRT